MYPSQVQVVTTFALGMLGALVGYLNAVTHPLVYPSRPNGVSVTEAASIEGFGCGFVFAFAMALERHLMLR